MEVLQAVICLTERAVAALLVSASGARGADDNHASTLAAVLGVRHVFVLWSWGSGGVGLVWLRNGEMWF